MLPSARPLMIPTGLSAVIDPVTKAFSYPWYCDWAPEFMTGEACKPATPQQIADSAAADLRGAAATQENQDALRQGVYDSISSDCSGENGAQAQADCLAYQTSQNCPTGSKFLGTGSLGQAVCSSGLLSGATPWLILAAVGVGAVLIFSKR